MKVIIDDIKYVPEKKSGYKIGIGVTVHNRHELSRKTIKNIKEFSPGDIKLVVIDDASAVPFEGATFRFNENVGISTSKNKCLELLDDCDHIFLFDDDTYPICKDWWRPYVESPEPHLMFQFTHFSNGDQVSPRAKIIYQDGQHRAESQPRGCMLYIKRRVLDIVGGFDTDFEIWGGEHGRWSDNIYNAGLTTWRYADVVNSEKLIHSGDQFWEVERSVSPKKREELVKKNDPLYFSQRHVFKFCEYKQKRNLIFCSYLVREFDHQRGKTWSPNFDELQPLLDSAADNKMKIILFHNCFNLPHKVTCSISPYFQRWINIYQFLRENEDVGFCFSLDCTDVIIQKNPFSEMKKGFLYVGSEDQIVGSDWMIENHFSKPEKEFIEKYKYETLLNCGIVGGDREAMLKLTKEMIKLYFDIESYVYDDFPRITNEMGIFNKVVYEKFANKFITGKMVHTEFKSYQGNNYSWFKHK